MKNLVLFLLFSCFYFKLNAQGATITGSLSVLSGTTETYSVTWDNWNTSYEYYSNVYWNVSNGTILSSNKFSVTIQWDPSVGLADGTGRIEVSEDLGGQSGQVDIIRENNSTSSSDFCTGILGPAKVFFDFGSGTNPGPALQAGYTSYQYNSSCTLFSGQYTITNNSNLCRSDWHDILSDHTGNTNGYFMMINASSSRGEIFRTNVTGLTTSFRYQFSAWVGNLYKYTYAQEPYIRFEIYDTRGNLIASSGSILIAVTAPNFQWQQVSFMFDLPPSVNDVQVVVANARTTTNDIGNDLVIDDISFAPCYPGILASFSNINIIDKEHTCNSGSVSLFGNWAGSIPFTNPSYQWQRFDGSVWSNISGATSISNVQSESTPGVFKYRILVYEATNPSSNVLSNEIIFYVQKLQVNPITTDAYACNGAPISAQLPASYDLLFSDPADNQSYSFAWSPSTHLSSVNSGPVIFSLPGMPPPPPSASVPAITYYTYTLSVTNTNYGCTSSGIQTVAVRNPRKVGVPNAFSPNGDGINDVWRPINLEDYPGSELSIWNRWGNRIFHSFGPNKADYTWDGKFNGQLQPQEVYRWGIIFKGCPAWIIGSSGEGVPSGDLTLFR